MRSKLNYLIGVSLKRKIKTKWFLVANVILAVVIAGIINIDSIITFFGGDFDKKTTIYVIDDTNTSYDLFKSQITETDLNLQQSEEGSYEVKKYEKSFEEAKKQMEEKEKDSIVVWFQKDSKNTLKATVLSEQYLESLDSQILTNAINTTKVALALAESNISEEQMNAIYSNATIERVYLDESKKSEDENMEIVMTAVFPIVILPFFMLTLFLVQMIGAEVNDEKTTRGMEIIISNVSPKTHFFAKVIAGNLFVLLQGILLVAFVGIGFLIRHFIGGSSIVNGFGTEISKVIQSLADSGVASKFLYIIPLSLILMILTFVAYSLLAGILASMTTNIEDFQQLQTPIIIISLIGYYLSMMAGVFNGALFIKVLSFVPFISAILAPSLLVLGQIGIFEVIVAILFVIITNWLLIRYGLRIYKVGILNYSSSGLWKKMFKALKTKE